MKLGVPVVGEEGADLFTSMVLDTQVLNQDLPGTNRRFVFRISRHSMGARQ